MNQRNRVIEQEWLDEQPPERAEPSLRDIVRINRLLGGHRVLRNALERLFQQSEAFTMLDVGAASGDMGRVVSSHFPNARITSLDYRLHHLQAAAYPKLVADAFRPPFAWKSFDVIHASLFLHHFESKQVISLLGLFRSLASRHVVITDLERHILAYWFLPATRWLFGWDPITLHDGPISVQAAFKSSELLELARAAGLHDAVVTTHRPAFRLCLTASAAG